MHFPQKLEVLERIQADRLEIPQLYQDRDERAENVAGRLTVTATASAVQPEDLDPYLRYPFQTPAHYCERPVLLLGAEEDQIQEAQGLVEVCRHGYQQGPEARLQRQPAQPVLTRAKDPRRTRIRLVATPGGLRLREREGKDVQQHRAEQQGVYAGLAQLLPRSV